MKLHLTQTYLYQYLKYKTCKNTKHGKQVLCWFRYQLYTFRLRGDIRGALAICIAIEI